MSIRITGFDKVNDSRGVLPRLEPLSGLFVLFGLMITVINNTSSSCIKRPHQEFVTQENGVST